MKTGEGPSYGETWQTRDGGRVKIVDFIYDPLERVAQIVVEVVRHETLPAGRRYHTDADGRFSTSKNNLDLVRIAAPY